MHKIAYTVSELTRELGIGRTKLYSEVADGKLVGRKIGNRTIFLASDVDKYLKNLPPGTE